jgi:hypothetical protein
MEQNKTLDNYGVDPQYYRFKPKTKKKKCTEKKYRIKTIRGEI